MRKKIFAILTFVLTMTLGADSESAMNAGQARDDQVSVAMLQVADQTGVPISEAHVFLVSDSGKQSHGKTSKGLIECPVSIGMGLEAYFGGKKGTLRIEEIRDSYLLTLPFDLSAPRENIPGVVVSVRPDDSDMSRTMVTISSEDPLISEPEVRLYPVWYGDTSSLLYGDASSPCVPPYSVSVRMSSAGDSHLWTGTAECECEHNGRFVEVGAIFESGTSDSVSFFLIYKTGFRQYFLSFNGAEMLCDSDSFAGSGRFATTENNVPAPANGDLVKVTDVFSLGFSDNTGDVRDTEFGIKLSSEAVHGLDLRQLGLWGWDPAARVWNLVSGVSGSCFSNCDHYDCHDCHFTAVPDFAKHTSYALFAPRSDDTTPPLPVTDLQVTQGNSDGCMELRWTAPADDQGVYAYDIRYGTEPLSESGWEDSRLLTPAPLPADPGTVQKAVCEVSDEKETYYFAIRSGDAANNWSAISFLDTPVSPHVTDNDGDGMSDRWEAENGLDPSADDSRNDKDRDGLTNLWEYEHDTSPLKPDSDWDGFSDGDEAHLGSDPRGRDSHPDSATVRIAYETGDPVRKAEVWLASDNLRSFQGKSDGEGLVISAVGTNARLDAYFAGRKASLDIDEIKDEYLIVMPPAQEDTPGIVASAASDDSDPGRVTLTIFADSPLSEAEVTLFQPPGHSADIPMTSADSRVWSGTADSRFDWGVFEITAVSESGRSSSAAYFEVCDIEAGDSSNYEFRETELLTWDRFSGSGRLVFTESPAPSPRNGGLVRVGSVRSLFFSENVGTVTDVWLLAHLSENQLGGLDFTQLNFFAWDTESGTWELVPEDGHLSSDFGEFRISPDSLDHTSYALFAPRLDDTIPPEPVTDFQARTGDLKDCADSETEGCVHVRWVSPADDQVVHTYDIRYDTVPVAESNWDDCVRLSLWDYSDDEPGIVHGRTIGTGSPGTAYYFGIRALDVAGNPSPIAFFNTPVISSADKDGDGMEDAWEASNGLNPDTDDAREDKDGDGLTNMRECELGLDPDDPDMDDDGYSDGDEMRFGGHPRDENLRPHGDLDCDSRIGLADVILALRVLISDTELPSLCLRDADWDGSVGLAEAVFVLRGMAGDE